MEAQRWETAIRYFKRVEVSLLNCTLLCHSVVWTQVWHWPQLYLACAQAQAVHENVGLFSQLFRKNGGWKFILISFEQELQHAAAKAQWTKPSGKKPRLVCQLAGQPVVWSNTKARLGQECRFWECGGLLSLWGSVTAIDLKQPLPLLCKNSLSLDQSSDCYGMGLIDWESCSQWLGFSVQMEGR